MFSSTSSQVLCLSAWDHFTFETHLWTHRQSLLANRWTNVLGILFKSKERWDGSGN